MFDKMFITLQVLRATLVDRLTDDEGATAVEYGIFVALIAAVIVALVLTLGQQIRDAFQTVVTNLS